MRGCCQSDAAGYELTKILPFQTTKHFSNETPKSPPNYTQKFTILRP